MKFCLLRVEIPNASAFTELAICIHPLRRYLYPDIPETHFQYKMCFFYF